MSAVSFNREAASRVARVLTVLVLDDDRFDRKRIMRWVKAAYDGPVEMLEAGHLGQFTTVLLDHLPDLIVMDYQLADGDGVDAMEIYANSCGNPSAYVVMVSGSHDCERARRAMACGCDRFIEKSDLNAESITQFMKDLRNVPMTGDAGAPHPKLGATEYWVARARRRDPVKPIISVPIPCAPPREMSDAWLFPQEDTVWNSDWAGARAFMQEFADTDELKFEKRRRK